MKICSVDGCDRKHMAKGLCDTHYNLWRRTGSTTTTTKQCKKGEGVLFLQSLVGHEGRECIRWPFGITGVGYGLVTWNRKRYGAHRAICEMAHGPTPFKGALALHGCGNRWCVNPNHLRFGTRKENSHDSVEHGTMRYGDRHPGAVLTAQQVLEIYADPRGHSEVAREYGCSAATVLKIRAGRLWKRLTGAKAA